LKIEYHRDIFNMPNLHISSGINPNKGLTSLFNENDCRLEGWVVVDKRRMLQSAFIFLIRVLPQLNNIRLAVTGGSLLPLAGKRKPRFGTQKEETLLDLLSTHCQLLLHQGWRRLLSCSLVGHRLLCSLLLLLCCLWVSRGFQQLQNLCILKGMV